MKKKALISSILTIALCLSLIAGSTFALFTAESEVNVAVSSGTVDVQAIILDDLQLYSLGVQQQNNIFENGGTASFTEGMTNKELNLVNMTPGDEARFTIQVTNNSNVDIQYRVKWAVDGELYEALTATVDGEPLKNNTTEWAEWAIPANADEKVKTFEVSVLLPTSVGNEFQDKNASIQFVVEAVQGNANPASTNSEIDAILEEGGHVDLYKDTNLTTTGSNGYGATAVEMTNGGSINGYGNSLTGSLSGGTWDSVIHTQGGLIENLTIGNEFRGIFVSNSLKEDLIINNVIIDNVCYTFNSDGTATAANQYKVVFNDSTINGWTSFSANLRLVEFNNCEFNMGQGLYNGSYQYAFMRPYAPTVLTNCTFSEDFSLDARFCDEIVLDNCYVGTTLVTAENVVALLGENAANAKFPQEITSGESIKDGGNFVLSSDVTYNSAINSNTTVNLAGNTFEATGTLNLGNNADLTMKDGAYEVNGTYGHVDVRPSTAEGSVVTFENVDFSYNKLNKTYGPSTNRLGSVVEICATEAGAKSVVVFKNCTFDNAQVVIEGMSGKTGVVDVTFENCTFNALTSSAPIYVQNYVTGKITVTGCTFNLECTSSTASAISVSSSTSTVVEVIADNNTINAVAATPHTYDAAAGETEENNVKVNGTPANIKLISYSGTVSTITETNTTKTGIAQ